MEQNKKKRSKILKFETSANFHYIKYQKLIDQGDYIDSLVALRAALQKDPNNIEYQFALAELYTEMDFFEESNLLLFKLIAAAPEEQGACLFGMGCNFFGLRDISKSKECFENYIVAYPSGEFSLEAKDFLEVLSFDEFDEGEEGIPVSIYQKADMGKILLDNGQYQEAVEVLEEIIRQYPDATFVKNNLALAYFCLDNTSNAKLLTQEVLKKEPQNAHAVCNMILFALAEQDSKAALRYRNILDTLTGEDADEDIKIALTYSELGEDDTAYDVLQEVLQEMPYDTSVIFFLGIAAVNLGNYRHAVSHFVEILKLRPDDTIAYYYKNMVQGAIDGNKKLGKLAYQYQVPPEEAQKRVEYIRDCFYKSPQELERLWETDIIFFGLLEWGMQVGNASLFRVIIDLIAQIGGNKAEEFLKAYLLKKSEPDQNKDEVFMALKKMGVKQPYVAYMSGKISEVRIGAMQPEQSKIAPSNDRVIEKIISCALECGVKAYIPAAVELFAQYVEAHKKAPIMRNTDAWALAFIYIVMQPEKAEDAEVLFVKTDILKASVMRCVRLIKEKMTQEIR